MATPDATRDIPAAPSSDSGIHPRAPEALEKVPGPLDRLAKKISIPSLQFRFFTPKPDRLESSSNSLAGRAAVDEREILGDPGFEPEPMSPVPSRNSDIGRKPKNWNTPSLASRSTSNLRAEKVADGPNSPMSECLDLAKMDHSMKDRLPVRSRSHDPRTCDEPFFNTDPYGPVLNSVNHRASSKSKSDGRFTRFECALRPCCENCLEAASKGSNPDHEIHFSPRALELYQTRANNQATITDPGNSPVQQKFNKAINRDWRRPVRNSLTKRPNSISGQSVGTQASVIPAPSKQADVRVSKVAQTPSNEKMDYLTVSQSGKVHMLYPDHHDDTTPSSLLQKA